MSANRSTFSESWYRVAPLRVRLLPGVDVVRTAYRHQTWFLVQDPANNSHYRMDEAAWGFVGLLDGRRTVGEAWEAALSAHGDKAPTQGEAIQLLGQLSVGNLLLGEIPPDTESLFQRHRKRRRRELQSALMGFLFPKFPLWDPDGWLDRWEPLVRPLFTRPVAFLWFALVLLGLGAAAGHAEILWQQRGVALSPGNLPWLYAALVVVKLLHEGGHAFACKHFGRKEGRRGEVHVTGIMLLLLTPLPYVDASSAWSLRRKGHRVLVGAAGIMVELALAALAALVWTQTAEGSVLHGLCTNVMFVASVSALLFNGNPLLRYDAYFILCDLFEMPNLAQRARTYLHHLVKRYLWGVRESVVVTHGAWERTVLIAYGAASSVYRVFLFGGILLAIAERLFIVGVVMALVGGVLWLGLPVFQFLRYLVASPELARTRTRALATTAGIAGGALVLVCTLPVPDRCRIEGVVESSVHDPIVMAVEGELLRHLPHGTAIEADGEAVAWAANPELETRLAQSVCRQEELSARRVALQKEDPAAAQVVAQQLTALTAELDHLRRQVDDLVVRVPRGGVWVAPDLCRRTGRFLPRGEHLGTVVRPDALYVRGMVGQELAARLMAEKAEGVEIRVRGRPEGEVGGRLEEVLPGGYRTLPTAALGFGAGGELEVDPTDGQGVTTAESFFEVRVAPEGGAVAALRPGMVVVMRVTLPSRSIFSQLWREALQVFQRRFQI